MADDYSESPSTLGRVSIGGSVTGSIETFDDGDWFAVSLTAGQSYDFRLAAIGSNGLTDPLLGLFDGAGNLVDFNDDGPSGFDSQLIVTASFTGTYYLGAYGTSSFDLGDYRLSAAAVTLRDDYRADTATTGTVSVGGTGRSASIDFAGDVDWFKVNLSAGTTYTIRLRGADSGNGTLGDPYFDGVYDASGRYLNATTNDDYGSSRDSQLSFTPAVSGSYYLAASAYDSGTGSYRLSVGVQNSGDIPASTATAATLAVGGTLRSTIGAPGDVDWVKVSLRAGVHYAVELNADGTTFNPLGDPLFVGIHDSAGRRLPGTTNDDYGIGLNSRVTFTPAASGTYYLAAGGYGDSTGAYALRLLSTTPSVDSVGQSPAGAAALTVGAPATSAIDYARDVDWFKVGLSAGQTYRLQVRGLDSNGGTLADPELLGIYDAQGRIVPGTGNDDAPGTLDSQQLFRPTAGGTYYLAVDAADDGIGTYTVSAVTATPTSDLPADATTAATLRAGTPLRSDIGSAGDVDWVKMTLAAGTPYRIDMLGAENGDGTLADPLIVGVYDQRGQALPGSSDDDGGAGLNARLALTAPAGGTYYLAVGSYGSGTGSYKLALGAGSADTTAPRLLATAPADGAAGVTVGSNLTLDFSEAVRAGSGNLVITGGGATRTIPVTDGSQVSFNGSTMTVNPASNLAAATDYTVTFGSGVVRDLAGNAFAGVTSTTQFNFRTAAPGAADSWTVMVYMAADNNLEPFAIADVNEMESVGLPGSVNVVTLLDRGPGYDTSNGNWTDTRVAAIARDGSTATLGSTFTSIGERDTGAGGTLTSFIDSTVASHPANHYALIVWNHGGGLSGTAWDDSSGGDNLTLPEMLGAVRASSVPRFDLVGFDACLQGMAEQAWDLRGVADVVVASQELEPGDGWEYQNFLDDLAANPNLTAYDLGMAIVDGYGQRYAGEPDTTLAATRTAALGGLKTAIDAFTGAAIAAGTGIVDALLTAASRATAINRGDGDVRDLGSFMREVFNTVGASAVKAAAGQVLAAIDHAVLARTGTVAGATGLSVYLPLDAIDADYVSADYTFLQGTTWGNLLRFMLRDTGADRLIGEAGANDIRGFGGNDTISGAGGSDVLRGGAGADVFVLNSLVGSDTIADFRSGTDKIRVSMQGIRVGDGDTVVEGAVSRAGPGGFGPGAELVVITGNIAGSITASSAAAKIGSASSAYAAGDKALFAVDNGSASKLYLFTSAGEDAVVSAGELKLLASLTGTPATAVGDYVFGA